MKTLGFARWHVRAFLGIQKLLPRNYWGGQKCGGGIPVAQLLAYVESAIGYGDIGPGTEKVVLMYGGMDAFQWVDAGGKLVAPSIESPSVFKATFQAVKNKVEAAAPGADVVFVSYPEFTTDDNLCLVNLEGKTLPVPAPGSGRIQEAMRESIKAAADYSGAQFIDLYEQSLGHGTCAPDSQRWIAGFKDPKLGPMTNHPTVQGEYGFAEVISSQLY